MRQKGNPVPGDITGPSRHNLSMALRLFVGPRPLFQFLDLYTVGRTPRTGDQPVARSLPIHRSAQTFMPQVGFEPTIPLFERAKTVYVLDRAANVVGAPCQRGT
jgi:hypothetical protein